MVALSTNWTILKYYIDLVLHTLVAKLLFSFVANSLQ